jgi:ketol-acid reductoisomerase
MGKGLDLENSGVDNVQLIKVNDAIASTGVEKIGKKLRGYMKAMKTVV